MALDPFSLVFNGLWTMMEDNPLIDDTIKLGNRIKFNDDGDRNPMKHKVQDSDAPELILSSEGVIDVNLHATSCSSRIIRRYAWLISTNDLRINYRLHPVEWAVVVGMMNWRSVLTALTWNDKSFVKRADIVDASNGMSDPERNRGIIGWSALWRCEVEMHFRSADLLQLLEGSSSGSS